MDLRQGDGSTSAVGHDEPTLEERSPVNTCMETDVDRVTRMSKRDDCLLASRLTAEIVETEPLPGVVEQLSVDLKLKRVLARNIRRRRTPARRRQTPGLVIQPDEIVHPWSAKARHVYDQVAAGEQRLLIARRPGVEPD
jgi:hypothetical protein